MIYKTDLTNPPAISTGFHRPDVINEPLYVITSIFNPLRARSRWKRYFDFKKQVLSTNAILVTIEASFGERAEVFRDDTSEKNHILINVRTTSMVWLKENLNNIACGFLPGDAKYIAMVDADISFSRNDWVGETLQLLQHYPVIQMYSHITHLGPDNEPLSTGLSFMEGWRRGIPFKNKSGTAKDQSIKATYHYPYSTSVGWAGSPGGAWAYRRETLNKLGGLIDFAILGSADYHMAAGLMGFMKITLNANYSADYKRLMFLWEENAIRTVKRHVGHMQGLILHHWHGKMKNRGYNTRWEVLVKHQFNPLTDLKKDVYGLWQLNEERWELRDDVENYFSQRNEDSVDV